MIAKLTPCLWFEAKAEEAARFYCSVFRNSRIRQVHRYPEVGRERHGQAAGQVMMVEFELEGQPFTALNAGSEMRFSEAISFQIDCADQAELDFYWEALLQGEGARPVHCGWLQDQYGLSWQVLPHGIMQWTGGPDPEGRTRAFAAMLEMVKLDGEALRRAYEGHA